MSIDVTQQPVQPSAVDLLTQVLGPVVEQRAREVATSTVSDLQVQIGNVNANVAQVQDNLFKKLLELEENLGTVSAQVTSPQNLEPRIAALEDSGQRAVQQAVQNAATDPFVIRAVTIAILVGCAAVLGAALLGNDTAGRWIGSSALGPLLLAFWHSTPNGPLSTKVKGIVGQ